MAIIRQEITRARKDMVKRELYTVGGNTNSCRLYGEQDKDYFKY